jgi:hypothetical protein
MYWKKYSKLKIINYYKINVIFKSYLCIILLYLLLINNFEIILITFGYILY